MEAPLVNRIAKSKIVTIDSGKYYPKQIYSFDLKDFLFKGLILREKEFREALKAFDWTALQDQAVHIHCSTDAIIPMWAYMLVSSLAEPHGAYVYTGNKEDLIASFVVKRITTAYPPEHIVGGKFVIKGCSDHDMPAGVYGQITSYLVEHDARSIMYGEPCSTVPIYKKIKPK